MRLAQKLTRLQWLIFVIGGLSTLLAALHLQLVITVTTAMTTALASYLEYNQIAKTLKRYNQTILSLTNIQNWWVSLGEAQADPENFEKLVDYVETTLQGEQGSWNQNMQTALTELRVQQAKVVTPLQGEQVGWGQQMQEALDKRQKGQPTTVSRQAGKRVSRRSSPAKRLAGQPNAGSTQNGKAITTTLPNLTTTSPFKRMARLMMI